MNCSGLAHSTSNPVQSDWSRQVLACRWLKRGGSFAALQQVFGRSSIVTTQCYAKISDDMVA